jgi:hypothetical protein
MMVAGLSLRSERASVSVAEGAYAEVFRGIKNRVVCMTSKSFEVCDKVYAIPSRIRVTNAFVSSISPWWSSSTSSGEDRDKGEGNIPCRIA